MSQSLARMWSHLIFSTRERHPFLADKEIREQLHAYMAAILRNHDCPTLQIGGATDQFTRCSHSLRTYQSRKSSMR